MKKYLILLCLLGQGAFASWFTLEPQDLCEKMGNHHTEEQIACYQTIKDPATFTKENLKFCKTFFENRNDWSLGNLCLTTIKNQKAQDKRWLSYCEDIRDSRPTKPEKNNSKWSIKCLQELVDGKLTTASSEKRALCENLKKSNNANYMMTCVLSSQKPEATKFCAHLAKQGFYQKAISCLLHTQGETADIETYTNCAKTAMTLISQENLNNCFSNMSSQEVWQPDLEPDLRKAGETVSTPPSRTLPATGGNQH